MRKLLLISAILTTSLITVGLAVSQQRNNAPAGRGAGAARGGTAAANNLDWPTFGGDNARTNANLAPTRITAANIGTMVRQQVMISGPIDAGLIYLRAVQINGAPHDTFFGTTNLGHTVAIDANDGKVLWEFSPAGFDENEALNPQRG